MTQLNTTGRLTKVRVPSAQIVTTWLTNKLRINYRACAILQGRNDHLSNRLADCSENGRWLIAVAAAVENSRRLC